MSSPSRFVRVAYTNTHYPQQNNESANVSRLFHTLASVQMVEGMSKMGNGQFERAVHQRLFRKTNTYYMNTYEDPAIRSFAMSDFDMDSSELITAD
ncbi:MAG: linear amide C-N hydrolase [Bifidobacterium dentium]